MIGCFEAADEKLEDRIGIVVKYLIPIGIST
jgi:hypothetical protein